MAMTGATSPLPNSATAMIAISSEGKAKSTSKIRLSAASIQPPRHPAHSPSRMPMTVEKTTTSSGPMSAVRPPKMRRLSRSRPSESVPSQWAADGGARKDVKSTASGSYGATKGAKIAARTIAPSTTRLAR